MSNSIIQLSSRQISLLPTKTSSLSHNPSEKLIDSIYRQQNNEALIKGGTNLKINFINRPTFNASNNDSLQRNAYSAARSNVLSINNGKEVKHTPREYSSAMKELSEYQICKFIIKMIILN
jgi:hypothetical protein